MYHSSDSIEQISPTWGPAQEWPHIEWQINKNDLPIPALTMTEYGSIKSWKERCLVLDLLLRARYDCPEGRLARDLLIRRFS